jgi:serine/threonine protein kinase
MEFLNTTIGKYKLTRLIGDGGMASVYEGVHETLDTKVAVKILNPILSTNKQIRERFVNEAKIMASFNHINITKIIDFEEAPNYLAIIMELLDGQDLSDFIQSQPKLSDEKINAIFKQILGAFQYAHEKGVIHRDIKPSNIFILEDGTVKILDFGIAKLFGQGNEMTQTGTQIGTPIFMSPEQVKSDKSIDHRSDIYSLGVMLYFLINGKAPYDTNTASQFDIYSKIVHEPLPKITIQSSLSNLVSKACQKERELRFQSCEEWMLVMTEPNDNEIDPNYKEKDKIVSKNDNLLSSIENKVGGFEKQKLFYIIVSMFLLIAILFMSFYFNSQLTSLQETNKEHKIKFSKLQESNKELESKRKKLSLLISKISNDQPFLIENIDFSNTNGETTIDNYTKKLAYSRVRYINPRIKITPLINHSKFSSSVTLDVKFIEPNGTLSRNPISSPRGYTFKTEETIYSTTEFIYLTGWGSEIGGSYEIGTHRVEVWYNGKLIGSGSFEVTN